MSEKSGTNPEVTKRKIIAWCKYAYQVSIGLIPMSSKANTYFDILTIEEEITTRDLFKNNKPLFVLGTIAHLIQDSYSQAHVMRDENDNILAFLVYTEQTNSGHKALDSLEAYEKSGGWNKAVKHVSHLFDFAFSNTDWSEVEEYLNSKVFRLSEHVQSSSGGGI